MLLNYPRTLFGHIRSYARIVQVSVRESHQMVIDTNRDETVHMASNGTAKQENLLSVELEAPGHPKQVRLKRVERNPRIRKFSYRKLPLYRVLKSFLGVAARRNLLIVGVVETNYRTEIVLSLSTTVLHLNFNPACVRRKHEKISSKVAFIFGFVVFNSVSINLLRGNDVPRTSRIFPFSKIVIFSQFQVYLSKTKQAK